MRKGTGKFKRIEVYIDVCNECGKELDRLKTFTYDFRWDDGYDSFGDDWEFCSMECLVKHLRDNITDEDDGTYMFPSGETVMLDIPSGAMKKLLLGE